MSALSINGAAVHIAWADLAVSPGQTVLSAEERARAERLRVPEARRRFIAARAFLRRELGGYLGIGPAHVPIAVDANGKPHLHGNGIQFNLSHSGDTAILAITERGAVGIDIEYRRDIQTGVAAKILSPGEYAAWTGGEAQTRNRDLLRAWTRKEAVLKAMGSGLRFDPRKVEVGGDGEIGVRVEGRHIFIRNLPCPDDVEGAVAVLIQ